MSAGLTRLWERLPLKKQVAQSSIRVFSNQEQQQQPEVEDDEGKQLGVPQKIQTLMDIISLFGCRIPGAQFADGEAAVPATPAGAQGSHHTTAHRSHGGGSGLDGRLARTTLLSPGQCATATPPGIHGTRGSGPVEIRQR